MNVDVQTTDEGARQIRTQVTQCLNGLRAEWGCEGLTEDLVVYCVENAGPLISNFPEANRRGTVQMTLVLEKTVQDGSQWVRECQLAVEIDADQANANLKQNGHLGCEIYFAGKDKCVGKTMMDARIGRRVFKMHAFLPNGENPPHFRHEPGSDHSSTTYPPSEHAHPGQDLNALHRCRQTRMGHREELRARL